MVSGAEEKESDGERCCWGSSEGMQTGEFQQYANRGSSEGMRCSNRFPHLNHPSLLIFSLSSPTPPFGHHICNVGVGGLTTDAAPHPPTGCDVQMRREFRYQHGELRDI